MICSKCSTHGVLVTVLGKDSWYCRTCKTDIELELRTKRPQLIIDNAQLLDAVLSFGTKHWRTYDDFVSDLWKRLSEVSPPHQD